MDQEKGFFAQLFDFSFSEFITPKIIKVLFALAMVGAVVYALILIGMGFAQSMPMGILALVLSPVAFVLEVIAARVYLELIMVIFRIADNTDLLAGQHQPPQAPPAPQPPPPPPVQ